MANFPIGVAVTADSNASRSFFNLPEKQSTISQHFNQVTAGNIMKMSYLHPSEGLYDYAHADALISWAETNGVAVHGHTFIWHSDYQVPAWMKNYPGDGDAFAVMLDEHVSNIATHFAGKVASWDVVNEAISDEVDENPESCYRNSLFYQKVGASYIENAFRAADAADPSVDLYYNDYNTEDGDGGEKFKCLLQIIKGLIANDVPIDGVGFQMHVQVDWPSTDAIGAAFEAIAELGLKVKITELDVPVNNPYGIGEFPQYTTFSLVAEERQKQRYKAIVEAYLRHVPVAQRGGITVWGLWDGDSWLLDLDQYKGVDDWPLLFAGPADGPYDTKPAFDGVVEALGAQQ